MSERSDSVGPLAVAVHEVAPLRLRAALRTGAELLAVIPPIVYGLVGIADIRAPTTAITGEPGRDGLLAVGLASGCCRRPRSLRATPCRMSRPRCARPPTRSD